jgi:hypothetical protein
MFLFNMLSLSANPNNNFQLMVDVIAKVRVVKRVVVFEQGRIRLSEDYRLLRTLVVEFFNVVCVVSSYC